MPEEELLLRIQVEGAGEAAIGVERLEKGIDQDLQAQQGSVEVAGRFLARAVGPGAWLRDGGRHRPGMRRLPDWDWLR